MLLAKENNATFICSNPYAMEYKAKKYGISDIRFISYGDFLNESTMDHEGNYVIDELEGFAISCFYNQKSQLIGYTMSKNE